MFLFSHYLILSLCDLCYIHDMYKIETLTLTLTLIGHACDTSKQLKIYRRVVTVELREQLL